MKSRTVRAALASAAALAVTLMPTAPVHAVQHASIHCELGGFNCTEVHDSESVFGQNVYVGHDEPSLLFYSNVPGSGNRVKYQLTLPVDPPPVPQAGRSFNFQLHPAFWVGMALCDTQSYPLTVSSCTADSDTNIAPLAKHPGTAFMELQFYPPGWAPAPAGSSCDPTRYCVAIASFSVSQNGLTGQPLNPTCAAITGIEYANYAFLTKSGHPHAPANPVDSTLATFTPDPTTDLFMNPGDRTEITMHDTEHGLQIQVQDMTSGAVGSMTMSAANSFGMVKFAPSPSTACTKIPYDFHPMYSTSSEKTRVTWAAHSYNIAFSDEIGHFDFCTQVSTTPPATCTGKEGILADREAAEGPPSTAAPLADDNFCFTAAQSTLVPITACQGTNTGFDGVPYKRMWPDGNPNHAGPFLFSSGLTGGGYNINYQRVAFEADLPRIEAFSFQNCNRSTGANCTLIPVTDDGQAANFYPFFSTASQGGHCVWTLGDVMPGLTTNSFGMNQQYGNLLKLDYLKPGGGTTGIYEDYRGVISNPCNA